MESNIIYDSSSNQRLRKPYYAQSLAEQTVSSNDIKILLDRQNNRRFRVIIGLGPGRSGTRSLAELLSSQLNVVHCEHEMIVKRVYPRTISGRIDISNIRTSGKGKWGADRRMEWDAAPLARGEKRSEEEEAMWRVLRVLEQYKAFEDWTRDNKLKR